jgi:hypothetical protein
MGGPILDGGPNDRGNWLVCRTHANLDESAGFITGSNPDVPPFHCRCLAFLPLADVGARLSIRVLSCIPFWPMLMTLTIGSSDRGSIISVEPRRGSMIGIKQLRLSATQPRVAQPHR